MTRLIWDCAVGRDCMPPVMLLWMLIGLPALVNLFALLRRRAWSGASPWRRVATLTVALPAFPGVAVLMFPTAASEASDLLMPAMILAYFNACFAVFQCYLSVGKSAALPVRRKWDFRYAYVVGGLVLSLVARALM